MRSLATVLAMAVLLIGCGAAPGASPAAEPSTAAPSVATSPSAPAAASPTAAGLVVLTLGDSWPQGDHCGGCATFAERYVEGLLGIAGEPVEGVNLSGPLATDSATLLDNLRSSTSIRDAVARADVVVIASGPNELGQIQAAVSGGTCGGDDGFDCIRSLGDTWTANFDEIVSEVQAIRGDQPTAIRLVNAANPFLFDPGIVQAFGVDEAFAMTGGHLLYQQLTDAMCGAAEAHGAQCLDVRPIINGPAMDQSGDENSLENHQAIADALVALGLPELED